jgi:predicted TIM-barrel fold metal-dependent hydrolase
MIADAHCHFFSAGFFRALGRDLVSEGEDGAEVLPDRLGWDRPGSDAELTDRWVAGMDEAGVDRCLLIASLPGDETSVGVAVQHAPARVRGAFMVNPGAPDATGRVERGFGELGLSTACLFPAMHHVAVGDPRSLEVFEAARRFNRAVFVHCGVLSVGVRAKLGLPSPFDLRLGDPLAVAAVAVRYPEVPVVIPHFGAGLFHEALMAASAASNILLDTSSSNGWVRFHPRLTLRDVFDRALDVVGPSRLLFGTDSSFFPRGWQRPVYEAQRALWTDLGVDAAHQAAIFGGNFTRVLDGT